MPCRRRSDDWSSARSSSWSSPSSCSSRWPWGRSSPRSSPRRALRAAGPRPQHHAGPGRPSRPGFRGVLRGRRVHGRPADLHGGVRHRRLVVLAGHPVRGAVRDAVRPSCWACRSCASAATTWPSPRWASARSSASWPARTCSSRGSADRAASSTSPSRSTCRPRTSSSGPVQIYYIALACRGGRRLRGLAPARVPTRPLVDGRSARTRTWPRGWASTWSRPSCSRTCWAAASPGLAGGDLGGPRRLGLRLEHPAAAVDQRRRHRHRRRHGQHPGRRARRARPDRPARAVPRVHATIGCCSTASP